MSYPTFHRINPPIEVVTPLGEGIANFLWGESPDSLYWGVCIIATGESWWFQNHRIRYNTNITMGRTKVSDIPPMPGLEGHAERNGVTTGGVRGR